MKLKTVEGGNPFFNETLTELLERQKKGEIRGLAIVYLDNNDKLQTDWVRNDGSSLCELSGAVNVLQTQLIKRMRQ